MFVVPIVFISPLCDITLKQFGLKATFTCEVSKAGLKADWLKNDRPIKRSDKYDVSVSSGTHELTVCDVSAEDIGSYTVRFEGAETSAKLKVNGKILK